ncbi:restriction endonuclease subunit S [Photobacterium leiognathi]|uniref:restriction endonuclease subunit S n=1 Tax=Photobacterium leiognathi TaxID=553611 RepID=UPI0027361310|nr:restriction endonuclease subunit S [Photobacterium leiognathi]
MSELPKGWVSVCLNDVVDKIVGGGTPSKSKPSYYTGEIPWMTVKDMNKLYLTDTIDHITQEAVDNSSTNVIPAGTPIIATRMSLGKIVRANFDSAINQDLKAIFVNSSINKFYFEYWYRSKSMLIESLGTGTTVKGVRLEVLKDLKFPLSSLNEQKRIVEKLDEVLAQVDTIKARLDGIPAILKRFRQSVLAAAVSGKLTEEWRVGKDFDLNEEIEQINKSREHLYLRDNAEYFEKTGKNLRKYDYSTLHEEPEARTIPNSWSLVQLGKLISFLTDYHANGSYEVLKEHVELKETEDYACMIRATNFEKNNFEDLFVYISQNAYDFLSKSKLYGNEILVGKIGNAGSVYLMPQLGRPASLAMNLFALRFDEDLISSEYLYMFLKSSIGERNIQKYIRGVATKSIDKKSLRSVFVNYPPFEEQKEIVRLADQYFAFADTIEAQVKKAQTRVDNLTQSILAKAFRGELVEQDPNDEPADKLLERIAAARKEAEALAKAAKKAAPKKRTTKAKTTA